MLRAMKSTSPPTIFSGITRVFYLRDDDLVNVGQLLAFGIDLPVVGIALS